MYYIIIAENCWASGNAAAAPDRFFSMASQAVTAGDIDVDFLPVIYQYLRW